MTFSQGLIKGRSHIAFMLGLLATSAIVFQLEAHSSLNRSGPVFTDAERESSASARLNTKTSELGPTELAAARVAWSYFVNNTQPETGLVNSVDGFESTTMWDQASYLLGLISAYRIDLIGKSEFDRRISNALTSMSRIELYDGKLPNKVYNTRTLAMVNYQNEVSKSGIGWSAIDIARVCVPLNIIVWNFPEHAAKVKSLISAWRFSEMMKDGILYGMRIDENGKDRLVQEGRLGYEEYAARAMSLIGLDTMEAARYDDYLKFATLFGVKIGVDSREYAKYHANNYVVSEPYILMGLELGFDSTSQELASRLLMAQEARFLATKVETAVSEDNIDRPPYFVYNTLYANGVAWNTITEDGKDASALRTVSTKAVFGWNALYDSKYTSRLEQSVGSLNDPGKGWFSGRYEADGTPNKAITANSNGVILEALHYRRFGRLVAFYN
jgi:hypothetical protein